MSARTSMRIERGDWQTPPSLASAVLERVVASIGGGRGRGLTVVEPTCGKGAFLVAAAARFSQARLRGYEINVEYTEAARAALPARRSAVAVADFFALDWARELGAIAGPVLVVGNPPWVTSAQLGVLGSANMPAKQNAAGLRGLDAVTGKSNFDVSEWMIVHLLEALVGRDATVAMLCKAAVARRVVETVAARELDVAPVGIWRVDAARHFDASVSAVLLVAKTARARARAAAPPRVWPVYADLAADAPESALGVVDGVLVADAGGFARTRHLSGESDPEWRSGIKHDCARVMELARADGGGHWVNGLGERVDIEAELVHPLLKSSDVANDRSSPVRAMILPQQRLGEDTAALRTGAPRAWKYLSRHRALLDARKSSIYEKQPRFAIFGVGPYSFAPWKVAVSGLYKRSTFTVVGPHEGRPVVLDDTCYFLAFDDEGSARRAAEGLRSPLASEFLGARIFWDAKRPITKSVLQTLDLRALETSTSSRVRAVEP